MKISLEFKDLRDLLYQLPKFGTLIASDAPYEDRIKTALEPDPETLRIAITPEDGVPFTPNEKEALRRLLVEFVKAPEAFTQDPDTVANKVVAGLKADGIIPERAPWAEEAQAAAAAAPAAEEPAPKQKGQKKAAQTATAAPDAAEETKATENTPQPENAAQKATAPSDADVRAALNDLLKQDRRDAVKKLLKSFGASNFSGLAKENYAAAIEAARGYLAMSDKEYKEAIKK